MIIVQIANCWFRIVIENGFNHFFETSQFTLSIQKLKIHRSDSMIRFYDDKDTISILQNVRV